MATPGRVTPPLSSLRDILEGSLPYQSSIYVVFARNERCVHVFSVDVNIRYEIALAQKFRRDQMNESTRRYYDAACTEMNLTSADDVCGFYNGLDNNQMRLFEFVCDGDDDRKHEDWANAIYITYSRSMEHNDIKHILGELSPFDQEIYGDLKDHVMSDDELHEIKIGVNTNSSRYTIFKLEQRVEIADFALVNDGYIFGEVIVNSYMGKNERNFRAFAACDLLRVYASQERTKEDLPVHTISMINEALSVGMPIENSWPVIFHDHLVFD